jgi:hypothetical protein
MKKCCYIKAGAAVGAVVVASTAFAGDVDRVDVNFAGVDYWSFDQGALDPKSPNFNGQYSSGQEVGRAFTQAGCSNLDTTVCWNTGATFENWASEMQFAMTATDGTPEGAGWYGVIAPYAGDDTGPATEGTCDPRSAPDEQSVPFPPFSLFVDDTGEVGVCIGSSYNDGVAQRAGTVNTGDFFFELGGEPNTACIDATGECLEVHVEPGCNDEGCCALVCDSSVGGDEFCCSSSWDSSCVDYAIALCDIYVYQCDAPAYPNDCASDPISLTNGETIAYDTTAANYDGPTISCAADGAPNVWFLVANDSDEVLALTASTCNQASYDTALTLWNAGDVGSTIDTQNFIEAACNDDGGGCADFSSILIANMDPNTQYLISASGWNASVGAGNLTVSWEEPEPQIPAQSCDEPGPDLVTQTAEGAAAMTANGVACAGGGITTENGWARVYTADELGGGVMTLNCVNFGAMNTGTYLEGVVNIYKDADGGAPGNPGSLELIGSDAFGFYGIADAEYNSVVFDGGLEIDISDGSTLVVELFANPSLDGFAAIAGGTALDVTSGQTYIRSDSCGIVDFTPYADIGFDVEWYVDLTGTIGGGGGGGCFGDVNGDEIVDGADFGLLLSAWGDCVGCPEDLDGSGAIDGADVGLLLSAWGACP